MHTRIIHNVFLFLFLFLSHSPCCVFFCQSAYIHQGIDPLDRSSCELCMCVLFNAHNVLWFCVFSPISIWLFLYRCCSAVMATAIVAAIVVVIDVVLYDKYCLYQKFCQIKSISPFYLHQCVFLMPIFWTVMETVFSRCHLFKSKQINSDSF